MTNPRGRKRSPSTKTPWYALTALREKSGMLKVDLARASGLSLGYVHDLETGRREPNPRVIKALSRALNVPTPALDKVRHHEDGAA